MWRSSRAPGWFADHQVEAKEIWRLLQRQIGWGTPQDVVDDMKERFGSAAAARVEVALKEEAQVKRPVPWDYMPRYTIPALDTIPPALFLDALEIGVRVAATKYRTWDDGMVECIEYFGEPAIEEINRLFTVRGIDYRFDERGKAEWHGDAGSYREVLMPALAALADPRLAGAAQEFDDALVALRQGTRTGQKNAIRDASNAVESAMKSVLDERGVARPQKETADNLRDALSSAGVVADKTKEQVCGPSHIRNTYGGHGPNPKPVPVPAGVAELAVQAAAAAMLYLAQLLP